jgi:hypothetical protein
LKIKDLRQAVKVFRGNIAYKPLIFHDRFLPLIRIISKVEGGLQELEEAIYWLELIVEAGIFSDERVKSLHDEADELTAMFVTMVKNVKTRSGVRK